MQNNVIEIQGAREHNLKNVSLTIPRDKLIVFTGVSGSGKSSLAFDTIYAEGQRRYVESLSSYARQFLGQMDKPDIDYIGGLSPAISIDQKGVSNNPRSTVGTVTEINDYLRLLFARIGIPHCPKCGKPIEHQSIDQIVDAVMSIPDGTRLLIIAPVVRARKGEHVKLFEQIRKDGYVRVRIDGEQYDIEDIPELDKKKNHTVEVVVDRLAVREGISGRLSDSIETAMGFSGGMVKIAVQDGEETLYSQDYACPDCGISIEELAPRMFSFNNPYGACSTCSGLGILTRIDPELIVTDKTKTLNQGALNASGWKSGSDNTMSRMYFDSLAEKYGFSLDTPWAELPDSIRQNLLFGTGKEKITIHYSREYGSGTINTEFEGVIPNLERRYRETQSDAVKNELEDYMAEIPCPDCHGKRLKPETLAVTVNGKNIAEVCEMNIISAAEFIGSLSLTESESIIASQIVKEISSRLDFLRNVGLEYLTLSRSASSLSGGEAQRIRLATQIGSGLVGVLYILDEPSIGLHQRDNRRLLDTLKHMRDLGNTLIVVEHDEETMRDADYIVDVGPGAGEHGGNIVASGTVEEICAAQGSVTGDFLSGRRTIPVPPSRRQLSGNWLKVFGCSANNLKNIDVAVPAGVFTCVTGVSGSGKSSMVNEIIKKALLRDLNRAKTKPGRFERMEGLEYFDKIIDIDQSPIGRTPRSNPATYTGLFDLIREVFAMTPEANLRGYGSGRFSFNVKGGRCEACKGDGILKIEMHFLPDVYVPCEICKGARYNRETLEVKYKDKSISDVLEMTVEEAQSFFSSLPKLKRKLDTLVDVGLGYVRLGQSSTTLSGGEAQRVKLATELSRRDTGKTLYVLDEPTTGLHMADVEKLIAILQQLCDGGSTVLVIEHNLDVIKTADYIIDLGPEGGDRGGRIVATGTPEQVARVPESYTGQYLARLFENGGQLCDNK